MSTTPPFLPYGRQLIDDQDIAAVAEVLRSSYLTTGPVVDRFEEQIAGLVGARHGIAVSSGTAALHLAALALGLGPGDKVIVPSVTFLATANAVDYVGAEVVFADVDPDSGLMEAEHLAAALARAGDKVRAVFPVHLAGQTARSKAITEIARAHDLLIVEDACHALGTQAEDYSVGDGTHADISVFSFHPVKTMTTGEGGLLVTRDDAIAERLRGLRNHGMERTAANWVRRDAAFDSNGQPNPWYYEMTEPGFNYRITDIQCALGLSQLKKLPAFISHRQHLVACYDRLLEPLSPRVQKTRRTPNTKASWHLYVGLFDFAKIGRDRSAVMRALHDLGIGTQVHYIPVHQQPYYQSRNPGLDLPGANAYYARCLSLPLFAGMVEDDVQRVAESIQSLL